MSATASSAWSVLPSALVCAGCGAQAADYDPYPFRCPNVGKDDADHLMTRVLETTLLGWPTGVEPNPFVRYRTLLHSYHMATARGMSDDQFVELVEALDKEVARVDGNGFSVTPFGRAGALSARTGFDPAGGVWVKDETGNVSGSHKARHLMGLAIHLAVVERLGLVTSPRAAGGRLAIASCGNAALAAGVVARAAGRPLDVFVPTWADPLVLERLAALGATITVCPREDGVPGDPTYHRLQRAVRDGSLPFTCQGPDNGLTIEGGQTLGWEMASSLTASGERLDRLFVQVGGGALASSVIAGFHEAEALGAPVTVPRIHAVQTLGGHPLERAHARVVARIASGEDADQALDYAAKHRVEFMWPWEEEPKSIAHGILDDETYDWLAIVRGMIMTGGNPLVVSEEDLIEANTIAREETGIAVDHTGTSGLAGMLEMLHRGEIGPGERVGVLFTGAIRLEEEGEGS